jgi:hypothetical protein
MKKKLTGTMQSGHVLSGIPVHGCCPRRPLLTQPSPHQDLARPWDRKSGSHAAAARNVLRGEIVDARLAPCDDAMTDCAKAGAGVAVKITRAAAWEDDLILPDHAPAHAGTPRPRATAVRSAQWQ